MRFTINDVGHGFCAHLLHENGKAMLWDCGHKTEPEHRPSNFLPQLGIRHIEKLFITNYDEDHISDMPNLLQTVTIGKVHRNISLTPSQLRAVKLQGGPISPAMTSTIQLLETYSDFSTSVAALTIPAFPNVSDHSFGCSYPEFTDTNNLSMVTFLNIRGTTIAITGDVEKAGWEKLLEDHAVRNQLANVDIFIASHHGRENGYCREVFDYCKPQLIVFSDSNIQYSTQEMTNTYASHASGMMIGTKIRKVVTTRNDGDIWFDR